MSTVGSFVVDVRGTELAVLGKIDPQCTAFVARVGGCAHVSPGWPACSRRCGVAPGAPPSAAAAQDNRITMLQGLSPLSQLTAIDLSHNRLILLDSIQRSAGLTALDVEANFLNDTQLGCLRTLTALTRLNIAGNSVTSLTPLRGLRELTHLCVSRNALRSLVRSARAPARVCADACVRLRGCVCACGCVGVCVLCVCVRARVSSAVLGHAETAGAGGGGLLAVQRCD